MQVPVWVEMLPEGGFRASVGGPLGLAAEARTQPEAIEKVRKLIEEKAKTAWVVHLDFPDLDSSFMRACGIYDPDDPMVQEWEAIIAENRRKADEDPDYP